MKNVIVFGFVSLFSIMISTRSAYAFDVGAGPIWNNADAQGKCPSVCGGLKWNGQWTTTVPGQMSVCGTVQGVDVPVGPIWNNADAQTKCPAQLRRVTWSGQWTTIVPNRQSVCGCNPPPSS